jgi:hypothetical protein
VLGRTLLACLVAALIVAAPAAATPLYVEPVQDGGTCEVGDPCDLDDAVNLIAVDGDEVLMLPGTYDIGSESLVVDDAITIRPLDPEAKPTIAGIHSFLMRVTDAATVRDIKLVQIASTINASTIWSTGNGALLERLEVTGHNAGVVCNISRGTMRDSTCRSGNSVAAVGSHVSSPTGSYSSTLVNVTAAQDSSGLGMLLRAHGGVDLAVDVRNSIISPGIFVQAVEDLTGSATATLSSSNFPDADTEGDGNESVTLAGSGDNQTEPPLLVHAPGFEGDFHQLEGSPTIDAGAPDALLGILDFEREDRIMGDAVDIGADEFFVEEDPDPDPDPEPDTTAPQTTITAQPKAKVKLKKGKKKAPYSFSFIADEAATFRCQLDDKPLVTCTSPFGGKVKKGTHTFSVFAVDIAGNEDATPATASWKVKKKKKKKR